jgi:hypothetical protein
LKFQHFLIFLIFWGIFRKKQHFEVEIGRNEPGILGVKLVLRSSSLLPTCAQAVGVHCAWPCPAVHHIGKNLLTQGVECSLVQKFWSSMVSCQRYHPHSQSYLHADQLTRTRFD